MVDTKTGADLMVGMTIGHYLPNLAQKVKKPFKIFSLVFIIITIVCGALAANWQNFLDQGYKIFTMECNVTKEKACQSVISQVLKKFGEIDILFNNAGITQRGLFEKTNTSVFKKVMDVNFYGALYCTKAALPSLIRTKGIIIVNESIAGVAPLLGRTGYSASKHALHGLFTSLRCELRYKGVHVMIVCPGFIRTNIQTRALGGDGKIAIHYCMNI